MFRRRACSLLLLVLATLLLPSSVLLSGGSPSASTADGVVEFLVFNSPECESCVFLDEELLPELESEYGERISYEYLDLREFENTRKMINLEDSYGRSVMEIPQVYIGEHALIGEGEIRSELERLIDEYLEAGGVDKPRIPEDGDRVEVEGDRPVYIAFFYTEGCRECDPVAIELDYMERYFEGVTVRSFDMGTRRGIEMNEAMSLLAGVPEDERGVAPSVFVGLEYLAGGGLTGRALQAAVEEAGATGTENPWERAESMTEAARSNLEERFRGISILPVLGAGLVDGINPCAFTVIVFLVSYLAFTGRSGRDLLFIGAAFAAGVFVTYLLIGVGLLSFMRVLGEAGKWVTLGVAVLTVIFGAVTLYDYARGRKSGEAESTAGLSGNVTRKVHRVIREKTKTRHMVAAAVVMGVMVGALELGCTGQVYLPTITFVARTGADRLTAVFYLLAYNLMFILPLLAVFTLAYAGTSSEKLASFGRKHANNLKLATALAFFALAALLFWSL